MLSGPDIAAEAINGAESTIPIATSQTIAFGPTVFARPIFMPRLPFIAATPRVPFYVAKSTGNLL
jgi:hypothetical protein